MPWNECKPMDERLRFVARLLEGEKMSPLCREFGISQRARCNWLKNKARKTALVAQLSVRCITMHDFCRTFVGNPDCCQRVIPP